MRTQRRNKWVRLAALPVACALVVTACGGDDDTGDDTADTTPDTTPDTTESAGAPETTADPGDGGTATTAPAGDDGGDDSGDDAGGGPVESNPRDIAGLFTIDDGIALWDERPADEDRTGVTDTEIIIGKHSPQTGPLAGIAMGPMLQTLIDEVNAAGGIHGRQIVFEDRDSAWNPAQGVTAAQELVEGVGIFAMFAGQGSAVEQAVSPYLEQQGVPNWSPNATALWAAEPTGPTRFTTLSPGPLEGLALAEYLMEQYPGGKIAFIFQNDDFGRAPLDPLKFVVEDAGGEVVEIGFELAQSADLTSFVQQAVAEEPDAIFILTQFPQFLQMLTTLRESLASDIPVVVGPAGAGGILPGTANVDGVVTMQWSETAGHQNPTVERLLGLFEENGVEAAVSLAPVALFQFESLVRVLQLAGPDLTREGLVEAAETGFDGSWTCSLCFGPMIYGPDDHWGIETVSITEWSAEEDKWINLGDPVSYETSEGNGIRHVFPEWVAEEGGL